jgi:hypothetical protein
MKANSYENPAIPGGNLEAVSPRMSLIAPEETPFYSACHSRSTSATKPETVCDTLRKPRLTGRREGAKFGQPSNKAGRRRRFGGLVQIFGDNFGVTRTQQAIAKSGGVATTDDEYVDSELKTIKEVKTDIEARCLSAEEMQDGGDDEREMRGFFKWIQSTAQATEAVPTDFRTPAAQILSGVGTSVPLFTETQLYNVLKSIAKRRGKKTNALRMFSGENVVHTMDNMSRLPGTTNNERYTLNADMSSHEIELMVTIFKTSHGRIDVIPDYFVKVSADGGEGDANAAAICDMDLWELHELEPLTSEPDEDDESGMTGYVIAQLALLCRNPLGNGAIFNT